MSKRRFRELIILSNEELNQTLKQTQRKLFDVLFQLKMKKLSDTAQIWKARKDIAMLKTIQTQRQKV
jgi:ribosomal protein L29